MMGMFYISKFKEYQATGIVYNMQLRYQVQINIVMYVIIDVCDYRWIFILFFSKQLNASSVRLKESIKPLQSLEVLGGAAISYCNHQHI